MEWFLIALIAVCILLILILRSDSGSQTDSENAEIRFAGELGEKEASNIIKKALNNGDYILNNVKVKYDGRSAELDNVIVNSYGVFIIEVKNYKGRLYGKEDDYEWKKYKDDGYGNTFEKNVKNPVRQVKRQVYILAKYLEHRGVRVWIDGYAMLLYNNSPVKSPYILTTANDINRAIHTAGKNRLSAKQIKTIVELLQ